MADSASLSGHLMWCNNDFKIEIYKYKRTTALWDPMTLSVDTLISIYDSSDGAVKLNAKTN